MKKLLLLVIFFCPIITGLTSCDFVIASTEADSGKQAWDKGNYAEALVHFRRVLKIYPDDGEALDYTADCLYRVDKIDSALSVYRYILKHEPQNIAALIGVGNCLVSKKDPEGGISYYNKALTLSPNNITALSNLAGQYYATGFYDRAIYDWTKLIDIDPKGFYTYCSNRILCYYMQKNWRYMELDLKQLSTLGATDAYYYRNVALLRLAQNDKKKACEAINKGFEYCEADDLSEELDSLQGLACPE